MPALQFFISRIALGSMTCPFVDMTVVAFLSASILDPATL